MSNNVGVPRGLVLVVLWSYWPSFTPFSLAGVAVLLPTVLLPRLLVLKFENDKSLSTSTVILVVGGQVVEGGRRPW